LSKLILVVWSIVIESRLFRWHTARRIALRGWPRKFGEAALSASHGEVAEKDLARATDLLRQ
jgi:hypothetical protein